jgi:dipeptide/tripeptide permease
MFSISGLEFSYTQAPKSMKSILQACWQLTVAFGNLLVSVVVSASFIDDQAMEFAFFAALMFVDMAIFITLCYQYKPIPLTEVEQLDEEDFEELKSSK